jgi:bromodomain adjacent to zinc finger domain protein 1A
VEYAERDEKEGRILVRPAVGKNLPFGDGFEKLLLAWSFLNVMGYVLFLSFQITTSI